MDFPEAERLVFRPNRCTWFRFRLSSSSKEQLGCKTGNRTWTHMTPGHKFVTALLLKPTSLSEDTLQSDSLCVLKTMASFLNCDNKKSKFSPKFELQKGSLWALLPSSSPRITAHLSTGGRSWSTAGRVFSERLWDEQEKHHQTTTAATPQRWTIDDNSQISLLPLKESKNFQVGEKKDRMFVTESFSSAIVPSQNPLAGEMFVPWQVKYLVALNLI